MAGGRATRGTATIAGVALAVVVGVLVGSAGVTFWYAEGLSYLSDDPRTCVNCHIMRDQFDAWQKASHHAHATCNDCHVPADFISRYATKIEHGWRHSKGFTLQDFHEPIRITEDSRRIVDQNCVRCHAAFAGDIVGHSGSGGGVDCIRCHSEVGHGAAR